MNPKKEAAKYNGRIEFLLEAFDNIFTEKEVTNLYLLAMKNEEINFHDDLELYNYFHLKYAELEMRNEKKEIKNKYEYIRNRKEAILFSIASSYGSVVKIYRWVRKCGNG